MRESIILNNSFRDVASRLSDKDPQMVEWLLQEAPALGRMPLWQSTFDEHFKILGGYMEVGEDKAELNGSAEVVFRSRLPHVLKKTGNDTETALIYNSFRASAIENKNAIDVGGKDENLYSMVAVRFNQDTLGILYDSERHDGCFFNIVPVYGGGLIRLKEEPEVLGYGTRLKTYLCPINKSENGTGAIVNIPADEVRNSASIHVPSSQQIDTLLNSLEGVFNGNNTFIYAHPRMVEALNSTYGLEHTTLKCFNKDWDMTVPVWNEVPIIGTYNMKDGTEERVEI